MGTLWVLIPILSEKISKNEEKYILVVSNGYTQIFVCQTDMLVLNDMLLWSQTKILINPGLINQTDQINHELT